MIGIVLAAGKASRLPNKALLPINDTMISIESAVQFCRRNHCEKIAVVVNSTGVIDAVMNSRGHHDLIYIVQPELYGVPDAISRGSIIADSPGSCLITYCDNIYCESEEVSTAYMMHASVRKSDNDDLDVYHRITKWTNRKENKDPNSLKFLGWILLSKSVAGSGTVSMSTLDLLNDNGVKPKIMNYMCYDIGTVDSYLNYIESKS